VAIAVLRVDVVNCRHMRIDSVPRLTKTEFPADQRSLTSFGRNQK
jgi:hypothetical protein